MKATFRGILDSGSNVKRGLYLNTNMESMKSDTGEKDFLNLDLYSFINNS